MTDSNQMSGHRRSLCLPIVEWPNCDQARWKAALMPGDALDPGGVASRWSRATCRKVTSGYGRYLHWLRERGELDPTSTPECRISQPRLAEYLNDLTGSNRGHTIQCRIQELGDAMRALAPDGDWRWILRAAGRLRESTVPARNKRARLRPIEELVAEGFRIMEEAERNDALSTLGRAALYRNGLVIAFLGLHPMRLRNLASLRIGDHLIEQGHTFVLKLAGHETKGHQAYEAVIAPRLSQMLKQYLRRHRVELLRARGRWHAPAGSALWISKDGSPCSEVTFANIIRKHARGPDGRPLSPHLFRTCAATSVAVEATDSVSMIPTILGHRSPRTAERFYNLAGSLEASREHSAMLEKLENDLARELRNEARSEEDCCRREPQSRARRQRRRREEETQCAP